MNNFDPLRNACTEIGSVCAVSRGTDVRMGRGTGTRWRMTAGGGGVVPRVREPSTLLSPSTKVISMATLNDWIPPAGHAWNTPGGEWSKKNHISIFVGSIYASIHHGSPGVLTNIATIAYSIPTVNTHVHLHPYRQTTMRTHTHHAHTHTHTHILVAHSHALFVDRSFKTTIRG